MLETALSHLKHEQSLYGVIFYMYFYEWKLLIVCNIYIKKVRKKCPTPFGQDCTWCTLLNWKLSLPHLAQGALQSHDLVADLIEMNLYKCHREMYDNYYKRVTNERKISDPFLPKVQGPKSLWWFLFTQCEVSYKNLAVYLSLEETIVSCCLGM